MRRGRVGGGVCVCVGGGTGRGEGAGVDGGRWGLAREWVKAWAKG